MIIDILARSLLLPHALFVRETLLLAMPMITAPDAWATGHGAQTAWQRLSWLLHRQRWPVQASSAPEPALTASAEPEAAITVDALAVRADLMFIAGLPEPGASAMNALASKATKGLVRLASKLVSDWPQARIDNLSRSYGNFDRVVALGWLL
jgi:hypothetical protein